MTRIRAGGGDGPVGYATRLEAEIADLQAKLKQAEGQIEVEKNRTIALNRAHDISTALLEAQRDEVNATLELIRTRELQAIARWRAEDVSRYLKQPDYGELLDWLNGERDAAKAALLESEELVVDVTARLVGELEGKKRAEAEQDRLSVENERLRRKLEGVRSAASVALRQGPAKRELCENCELRWRRITNDDNLGGTVASSVLCYVCPRCGSNAYVLDAHDCIPREVAEQALKVLPQHIRVESSLGDYCRECYHAWPCQIEKARVALEKALKEGHDD